MSVKKRTWILLIGLAIAVAMVALLLSERVPSPDTALRRCRGKLENLSKTVCVCRRITGTDDLQRLDRVKPTAIRSWRVSAMLVDRVWAVDYDCDEPWDSPQNRTVWESRSLHHDFVCPYDREGLRHGTTSYVAVLRKRVEHPTLGDVVCFAEIHYSRILWTEPRDVTVQEACAMLRERQPWPHFGAFHIFLPDAVVELVQPDPKDLEQWFAESEERWTRERQHRALQKRTTEVEYFDRRPKR